MKNIRTYIVYGNRKKVNFVGSEHHLYPLMVGACIHISEQTLLSCRSANTHMCNKAFINIDQP